MDSLRIDFYLVGVQNYLEGCLVWSYNYLSRCVLPKNLRRGPYAVVDERCEDTTLYPSIENFLLRHFCLLLDPSMWEMSCLNFCYFFRPLYVRNKLPKFLLLLCYFLDLVCEKWVASIFATFVLLLCYFFRPLYMRNELPQFLLLLCYFCATFVLLFWTLVSM